ncbi:MAG: 4-hydroxy-tetrahydrodipicolinate reductase [Phycisphaerae bacterium]|nr:4-hydroxy-tetrahydrodipicolinate reductase [Phycisphaerae bacterium]
MSSTHSATRIMVHGGGGRMGVRVIALAREEACEVVASCDRRAADGAGGVRGASVTGEPRLCALADAPDGVEVVVDFTSPSGALDALKWAVSRRIPLLVGTTGLDDGALRLMREGASRTAVLVAPNTSLGVAVLADAVARAARRLGASYACSIVEAHHDKKKDAPSGTAKRLASAARSGGGQLRDDQILAIRGGDVVGEHTVRFAGAGEYLEFTHRATSRDLFARGALRAARWLRGRAPGWYTLEDTLDNG